MASWLGSGGVAMVPLGICAIALGAIAVERAWFWLVLWRRQGAIMEAAIAELDNPTVPPEATRQWLTEQAKGPFPLARVLLAGLTLERPTPEEFALALETAARQEIPTIKRFQSALGTIASVAPLLGLLGTILGLMRAFATLPSADFSASAGGVAAGIAEALVSTAAGLVIAVAALVIASGLRGLARRQGAAIAQLVGQLELRYRRTYEAGEEPFVISR